MVASEVVLTRAKQEVNQRWWSLAGLLSIIVAINYPSTSLDYWPILAVFSFSVIYNFILSVLIHKNVFVRAFSIIESVLDIVLISVLIHYTGGLYSSYFYYLYPLVIFIKALKNNTLEIAIVSMGIVFGMTALLILNQDTLNLSVLIDRFGLIAVIGTISGLLAERNKRRIINQEKLQFDQTQTIQMINKENEKLKQDVLMSTERLQDVTMTVMKKNLALMAFQEIYSAMSSTHNPRRLLNLVIDTAMSLMQGTAGCLMIHDEYTDKLKIKVARGMDAKLIRTIQPKSGENIEGQVFKDGQEALYGDLSVTVYKPLLSNDGRSKICVPLVLKNKPVGVLSIENATPEAYNRSDLELLAILGSQASEVLQNIEIYQEMRDKADGLELLFEVNKNIGTIFNLRKLFAAVLERAMQVMKARKGSLLIYEKLNDELIIRASLGLNTSTTELSVSVDKGIAGWVYQNVKPIIIRSVETSELYDRENDQHYAGKDLIACPLNIRKKIFGVICLNDRLGGKPFTKDDLELLGALASQAAIAIENVELYASIRRDYINAVKALAAAVDAKDHYTHGHSNKVMAYSTIIAKELGMSEKEVEKIRYGSLLHDVGKIGISEALLNKPSRLTPKEFDTIAMHPILGVSIVQNIESLRDLIPTILYHHERYNGGGYPEGKAGNSIPLGARIVAVADAWDVMTSDRAYRKALPISVAVSELKKCSGTQFDPELVEVFLTALKKNEKIEPFKEEEKTDLVWDEEGINWIMD